MSNDVATLKVEEVSFHRNGVCGVGFTAVLFRWQPDGAPAPERFVGVVFDAPGECAILSVDRIAESGVRFGVNSWRGDNFEPLLRKAIEEMHSSGSVRVGPFALPTGKPERRNV